MRYRTVYQSRGAAGCGESHQLIRCQTLPIKLCIASADVNHICFFMTLLLKTVTGGIASGQTADDAMVSEAQEEAGFDPDTLRDWLQNREDKLKYVIC